MVKWMMAGVVVAMTLSGCGAIEERVEDAEGEVDASTEAARQKFAAEVTDRLQCANLATASVRERTKALISGQEGLDDLDLDARQFASVLATTALAYNSIRLLTTSAGVLATKGHLPGIAATGWEGLACQERRDFACETDAGGGATQILCDASSSPDAVRLSLEAGCHIAGQRTEGDVVRARNGSWRFEAYEIEDRYLIEGAMALQRDPVGEVMGVRVAPTDGLEMTSYPGLSCASSFAFERLDTIAGQGEDRLRASFDARKSDSDKTITLRVPEAAPLRWTKGGECVCPAAGGRLSIALSDAFGLGGRGEVAVAYGAPAADAETCRSASVTLETWPSGCPADATCGRAAIESVLSKAITAACVPTSGD